MTHLSSHIRIQHNLIYPYHSQSSLRTLPVEQNRGTGVFPRALPFSEKSPRGAIRAQYEFMIKMRLGILHLEPNLPHYCACRKFVQGDCAHFLSCVKFAGQLVNHRHKLLCQATENAIRRAGGFARSEPAYLQLASGVRPDIDALFGLNRALVDCTIRTPDSQKPLTSLAAAAEAEADKHRTYDALAADLGAKVVPFAIETFGAWGEEARNFMLQLRNFVQTNGRELTASDFYYWACSEISIAVQRGNARAWRAAIQAARAAEQPRFSRNLHSV